MTKKRPTVKKLPPAAPVSRELLARLPSLVTGKPGEAMALVHTILLGADQDDKTLAVFRLSQIFGDATQAERIAVDFFVEAYALLFHSDGRAHASRLATALKKRKGK